LAFIANAMHGHDPATFHEKPQNACIKFADVAEFEKSIPESLGQWFAVILAVAQLRKPSDDGCEVTGIGGFHGFEKFTHRASSIFGFVKLYGEVHI
jgi:hypothetical protein